MTFVYDPSNIVARDLELGLQVDRDIRFRNEAPPAVVFEDTIGAHSWICPIVYDHEQRPDLTSDSPSTYRAEVACRISRKDLARIAIEVAEAKAAQGVHLSADEMARRLLDGATVYITRGGKRLKSIPDFKVILTD